MKSPWGVGCFSAYLGDDQAQWKAYDATELIKAGHTAIPVLIDRGSDDEFLAEQLFPQDLQTAYTERGATLRYACKKGMTTATILLPHSLGSIWLTTPRRLVIRIDVSYSAFAAAGVGGVERPVQSRLLTLAKRSRRMAASAIGEERHFADWLNSTWWPRPRADFLVQFVPEALFCFQSRRSMGYSVNLDRDSAAFPLEYSQRRHNRQRTH